MMVGTMKSENSNFSSSTEAGEKILSRFLSVDELLIRPSADMTIDTLAGDDESKKVQPRISLVRFQELEQCIRNFPADPAPYEELARIYFDQERWRDARRVLDLGVTHNPNYEPMLVLREESMLQSATQELENAKKQLRRNRSEENEQHRLRCETDLANLRLSVCEARLARHPEQLDLLIPCAIALRQLGRMDEAVERLRKAQGEPSLRSRASLQLGMCLQQIGDVTGALGAYRKAALYRSPAPSPDLKKRALELAAELAEQQGMIHSAMQYTQLLIDANPTEAESLRQKLKALSSAPL